MAGHLGRIASCFRSSHAGQGDRGWRALWPRSGEPAAHPHEARPYSEYMHIIRADLQSVLDEFKRRVERSLMGQPSSGSENSSGF
jgi:hypothetical protein